MNKFILIAITALTAQVTNAQEPFSLSIASLAAGQVQLQGLRINLNGVAEKPQQASLTIEQLTFPKPFQNISHANIHCGEFRWQGKEIICKQGHAKFLAQHGQALSGEFFLHVNDGKWDLTINAQNLDAVALQNLLQTGIFGFKEGRASFNLTVSGKQGAINAIQLSAKIKQLTGQTPDSRYATEKLNLYANLQAQNHNGTWQWRHQTQINGGAIYAEPLYLEAGAKGISLDTLGRWSPKQKNLAITSLNFRHGQATTLTGKALLDYAHDQAKIAKADLTIYSDDLQTLSKDYLSPFFEQTPLAGISFKGQLKAQLAIAQNALASVTAQFDRITVDDSKARIGLTGGTGIANWSADMQFQQPSYLGWQQLELGGLPVGASKLVFAAQASSVKLLEDAYLPFLGGTIAINQLGWQAKSGQEPEIRFAGKLADVSLEQLSKALGWTPLSGKLSGTVPGVEYRNKTLSLNGELSIHVFDGTINVSNLATSGLFADFPKLYAELAINNLDLDQLTNKFEFGNITGKLSGFVKQLYLENWHPVSFFAWLGTPDDDNSSHKISQKAVKNIASIGGTGASDLVSKGFLSIFETFSYDKIGLGCYLNNGVCQLIGVEASGLGYSIIKGGGLPRIDVIGYNPRVDWAVLLERLNRINTTDEVIIK